MSKELEEALKTIKIKCHSNSNPSPIVDEALEIVEQALLELQAIKEAKPSEALKGLEFICKILKEKSIDIKWLFKNDYNIIKQALQQKIAWKHIHNTKVRVPLIQIFSGKTQEEKHQIIEDIYYNWEERKEALEDKNQELRKENVEYKKALKIIFEKKVNIEHLRQSHNVREYNSKITIVIDGIKYAKSEARKLTKEEFNLLKKWLKEDLN